MGTGTAESSLGYRLAEVLWVEGDRFRIKEGAAAKVQARKNVLEYRDHEPNRTLSHHC